VLVIDDGSTDRTAEVAELAGAKVIKHPANQGKGAVLRTGFKAAGDADIIITMDTDGQHDPAEIPKLIAPILAGEADMVNGSRYIEGNGKNTPAYRRVGQKVPDKATHLSSGLNITDSQSGFLAYAIHIAHVFMFIQNDFGIESEMLTDAANTGLNIPWVESGVQYQMPIQPVIKLNRMHYKPMSLEVKSFWVGLT
jgi:glycosyltransferase involved in cell wall biosynthesis